MKNLFLQKLILFSSLSILLLHYIMIPSEPNTNYKISIFILIILSTFSFLISLKIKYTAIPWISINIIFIIGYFIVFFQMILLDFFGYHLPGNFYEWVWVNKFIINKSLIISAIGLVSYYLGVILMSKVNELNKKEYREELVTSSISFTLFLAYLFYILFIATAGSYIYGEYTPDDASSISVYFYKLFKINITASIILRLSLISSIEKDNLSIREYLSYFGKPLLLLLGWFILFSIFIGDRGPIIYFTLLSLSLYFIRWKKISFIKIVFIIIIMGTFLTIIGEIRQARHSGASYSDRVSNVLNSSNDKESTRFGMEIPGAQTLELALSVRTLNHSIYNIPDKYDYAYGLFQLKHLYATIPGLSGIMTNLLYDGDNKYNGSSNFITYLIQGNNPRSGDGSSLIADFYLDFGIVGVVIGLFLFGLFIGKNEIRLFVGYQKPTFLWVAILVYLSQALYINRSAILFELSNIVLIYIFMILNIIIVKKYSVNKRLR